MDIGVLRARALYGVRQNVGWTVAIDNVRAVDPAEAVWWTEFATRARVAVENFLTYTSVPTGIPLTQHAFVVLGSGLTSGGTMTTKLIRRLELAAKAAKAYPNSKLVLSGGSPKNGVTEAAAMKKYLIAEGVASSRLILEDKSASTTSNGRNSVAKLVENKLTSYTIISDATHLRRATLVFEAAKLRWQYLNHKSVTLKMVKNYVFPDDSIPKLAGIATRDTVFLHAAYTLQIDGAYAAAISNNEISYPTLRVGSTGEWVTAMQVKLRVVADGKFGLKTKAAVEQFQKARGLIVDGVAGPHTLRAMGVTAR